VRRFPPSGSILDVGGGNGYVTKRLLDEGFEAVLLEPGAVGAWNGKTLRQLPEVICSTLEDAAFPCESLDAIGCFDVIEHVADDRAFVRQLHGLLVADGLLYATVPAHAWLWSRSDVDAEHHRRYDRAGFCGLLREAGFDLSFFSYFFAPLVLPILLLRVVPFRAGIGRRPGVLSDEAEHGAGGGAAAALLRRSLRRECTRIANGIESPFGASALVVARKRS
jgi:SAM-dependent methyltransferase